MFLLLALSFFGLCGERGSGSVQEEKIIFVLYELREIIKDVCDSSTAALINAETTLVAQVKQTIPKTWLEAYQYQSPYPLLGLFNNDVLGDDGSNSDAVGSMMVMGGGALDSCWVLFFWKSKKTLRC